MRCNNILRCDIHHNDSWLYDTYHNYKNMTLSIQKLDDYIEFSSMLLKP